MCIQKNKVKQKDHNNLSKIRIINKIVQKTKILIIFLLLQIKIIIIMIYHLYHLTTLIV